MIFTIWGGTKSPLARIREKIKGVLTREGKHQLSAEVHDASTTRNCDADRCKDLAVLGICIHTTHSKSRSERNYHTSQDRTEPRRLSACHLPHQLRLWVGGCASACIQQNRDLIHDRYLGDITTHTCCNRLDLDGGHNHCVIAGAVA